MKQRTAITSQSAPSAIGPYSQAIRWGDTVYLSGQIPLDPKTMKLIDGDISAQARRVFDNLQAVARSAGTELHNAVKINLWLTDLADFQAVNAVMSEYFTEPLPARACVGVAALPAGAQLEADAIISVTSDDPTVDQN